MPKVHNKTDNDMRSSSQGKVTVEEAEVLIMWPKGCIGYDQEMAAVKILLALAESQGYGRLSQLAQWIEQLWQEPRLIKEFQRMRDQHLVMISGGFPPPPNLARVASAVQNLVHPVPKNPPLSDETAGQTPD